MDRERRRRGGLERDIIATLLDAAVPLPAADVRRRLGGTLAYTTVMTVLTRLAAKGLIERSRSGRGYVYRASTDASDVTARRTQQRLGADSRVPPAVGIACAALVCVALVRLAVTVYRRAASIVSVVRCCRRLPPTVDRVVVVDSPKVEAFTTPPPGARIVVTSALLRHLPPDEGRALLAHERSHLTHRHVWWILAADLAAAVNPLLVPTADAVRRTVARWADEDAARVLADRTLLARSLARTALLAHGSADRIPRATGGDVADR